MTLCFMSLDNVFNNDQVGPHDLFAHYLIAMRQSLGISVTLVDKADLARARYPRLAIFHSLAHANLPQSLHVNLVICCIYLRSVLVVSREKIRAQFQT